MTVVLDPGTKCYALYDRVTGVMLRADYTTSAEPLPSSSVAPPAWHDIDADTRHVLACVAVRVGGRPPTSPPVPAGTYVLMCAGTPPDAGIVRRLGALAWEHGMIVGRLAVVLRVDERTDGTNATFYSLGGMPENGSGRVIGWRARQWFTVLRVGDVPSPTRAALRHAHSLTPATPEPADVVADPAADATLVALLRGNDVRSAECGVWNNAYVMCLHTIGTMPDYVLRADRTLVSGGEGTNGFRSASATCDALDVFANILRGMPAAAPPAQPRITVGTYVLMCADVPGDASRVKMNGTTLWEPMMENKLGCTAVVLAVRPPVGEDTTSHCYWLGWADAKGWHARQWFTVLHAADVAQDTRVALRREHAASLNGAPEPTDAPAEVLDATVVEALRNVMHVAHIVLDGEYAARIHTRGMRPDYVLRADRTLVRYDAGINYRTVVTPTSDARSVLNYAMAAVTASPAAPRHHYAAGDYLVRAYWVRAHPHNTRT